MPSRDSLNASYMDALDIARRYMGGSVDGYEGGGEVDDRPEKPSPSWYDYATGAAGLANRGLMGIPGTAAALGNAALAGVTLNDPSDAYWRTQRSATDAADLGTKLYGRDARAMVEEYPGTSMMKGAATAASHGIGNMLDAGVSLATILTPAMARRLERARIIHPDDVGGSRRMEQVAEDYKNSGLKDARDSAEDQAFINKAWQEHGVAPIPNENGDYKPWSHLRHPSQVGLRMGDMGSYDGPLHGVYDDPVQFALVPASQNARTRITIDPKEVGSGSFDPTAFSIEANAGNAKGANSILGHELTHLNAQTPAFDLPQGKHWNEYKPRLPEGLTTNAVEATRKRMDEMIELAAKSPQEREAAELALELLGTQTQPFNKRFAQYLESTMTPGEFLARMDQVLGDMKTRGINPQSRLLTEIDDLDLRDAVHPRFDLRQHRLYEKPRSPDE